MKLPLLTIALILSTIGLGAIMFTIILADKSEVTTSLIVAVVATVGSLICAHIANDMPHARKKPAK